MCKYCEEIAETYTANDNWGDPGTDVTEYALWADPISSESPASGAPSALFCFRDNKDGSKTWSVFISTQGAFSAPVEFCPKCGRELD